MSLDSLTDMVSNAVGVLILLLLMTAIQSSKPTYEPPLPIAVSYTHLTLPTILLV